MKISQAIFLQSNITQEKCPPPDKPEYAFIGRSNVGKSSLINILTQKPGLAKTSGRPGKTQMINHFLINDSWFLVDLPGYGYAKVSKTEKATWGKMIQEYLEMRENLVCTFVLIDSRHPPQKIDLEFLEYLSTTGIPFVIVFTKTDKQSKAQTAQLIEDYVKKMLETWEEMPFYFVTSAVSRVGREEILEYIGELNPEFVKKNKNQ